MIAAWPSPALLELMLPAVAEVAAVTYAASCIYASTLAAELQRVFPEVAISIDPRAKLVTWPRSSRFPGAPVVSTGAAAIEQVLTTGAAALAQIRLRATACPDTAAGARRWHELVRRDAELDHPLTPHGRALRNSSRPWPGLGQLGECLCGSSLVFHALPDEDVELQPTTVAA